ncbi:hypothetical protein BDF21DRAFT_432212, partial [Thamnidium elegans]
MNRSGPESEGIRKPNEMMMHPHPQPMAPPMLRRGLSLLGGLFGGGGDKRPYGYEDFNNPQMRFAGNNFSEPMQAGGAVALTKKEERKAQQYQKLGTFWCWRLADSENAFQSFSIPNQKIIKRKGENPELRGRILLGKEKNLPGDIMVDLNNLRGGCMTRSSSRGPNDFVSLDIKPESFDGSQYVFN